MSDDADPTAIGAPDETAVVPPVTRTARPRAWSDDDDDAEPPPAVVDASWRAAFAAASPILFAAAVIAVLIVAGTSWYLWAHHAAAPTPDERFRAGVRAIPGFTGTDDWDLAEHWGRGVCLGLEHGSTRLDIYEDMHSQDPSVTYPRLSQMIDVAIDAYCPQERGKLS